jgi:hypothetical protein
MQPWLLIAAASHVAAANTATEVRGFDPVPVRRIAAHSIDFRLSDGIQRSGLMFREIDLARQIGSSAQVGVGMSDASTGSKDKIEMGTKTGHRGSQGPVVSFVLKF